MTRDEYQLTSLGSFNTEIVGIQYYNGKISAGDEVVFERAPENPYDSNAVEAHNSNDELAGHLPRIISLFLAPLVDAGHIFLKGVATGNGDKWKIPMNVTVYTTPKGADLLTGKTEPLFENIVHKQITDIFRHSDGYPAELLDRLCELYKSDRKNLLPETRLVLHLLHGKAEKKRTDEKAAIETLLAKLTHGVSAGEPVNHGNITVVPLFRSDESGTEITSSLTGCLEYGYAGDTADNLHILKVRNNHDMPVLVTGGECPPLSEHGIMVRRSRVIKPFEETDLSFYRLGWSVEWFDAEKRYPAMMASPDLRMIPTLSSDCNAGNEEEEQREILDAIDTLCAALYGPTNMDYRKLLEMRMPLFPEYEKALTMPENASGYVIFHDDILASCDIFCNRSLAAAAYPFLLQSVLAWHAAREPLPCIDCDPEPLKKTDLMEIITGLLNERITVSSTFADNGMYVSVERSESTAEAVLYNGVPVHVAIWNKMIMIVNDIDV